MFVFCVDFEILPVSIFCLRYRSKPKPESFKPRACAVSLEVANSSVEGALLKRATGYTYTEKTWELIEGELRISKVTEKHVPPDVKAILSWLYNRLPGQWRAVQEPLEVTQYTETIKNILVAMKEVADGGSEKVVEVEDAE